MQITGFPTQAALMFGAKRKKPAGNKKPVDNSPKADSFNALPDSFKLSFAEKLIMVKLLNTKLMPASALGGGGVKRLPGAGMIPNHPMVYNMATHVEVSVPDAKSEKKVLKALKEMDGFGENPAAKNDPAQPKYVLNDVPVHLILIDPNKPGDGFRASDV